MSTMNLEPQLYTVPETMQILRYSRSRIYRLIRSGRLSTVKEGNARRVPADSITAYLALLSQEAQVA